MPDLAIAGRRQASLLEMRTRWQRAGESAEPAVLRVALLASYTIDPLAPYLGVLLESAGFPATIHPGPFNQIVQQCLDEHSETALLRPNVLVVSPRFEELLGAEGGPAASEAAGWVRDLVYLAETALGAAERWRACLYFVLPAIPDHGWRDVGDDAAVDGVAAAAVAAREAVRARLWGLPSAYVVDLEAIVRRIGSVQARHRSLFQFARIPFTEEVFFQLAERLSRTLRLCLGDACLAVAVDADSLLLAGRDPQGSAAGPAPGAEPLLDVLRDLKRAGTLIAIFGAGPEQSAWRILAAAVPELADEVVDAWAFGDGDPRSLVGELASELNVPAGQVVALTASRPLAEALRRGGSGAMPLLLEGGPADWRDQLGSTALFDRLPARRSGAWPAPGSPGQPLPPPGGRPRAASLAEFVAGLHVRLAYGPLATAEVGALADMVRRTHDFTLGIDRSEAELAALLDAGGHELVTVRVQDRLGDYGTGAAYGIGFREGICTVDLLLVSCPVLGRGVEDALMHRIVDRATARGCSRVVLPYVETGRNRVAIEFALNAAAVSGSGAAGARAQIEARRLGPT